MVARCTKAQLRSYLEDILDEEEAKDYYIKIENKRYILDYVEDDDIDWLLSKFFFLNSIYDEEIYVIKESDEYTEFCKIADEDAINNIPFISTASELGEFANASVNSREPYLNISFSPWVEDGHQIRLEKYL